MANLGTSFDASQVDPTNSFDPIPPGKYPMMFTDSEMKTTKEGTGQYLQLTAEVIDGPCKGRLIWTRLNLQNPNQTTVEIAQRELSAICHSVGVLQVQDSAQLHNLPFLATVKIRPAKGDFDASNEIKNYEPLNGTAPKAAANDESHAPAPQVANGGSVQDGEWWNNK